MGLGFENARHNLEPAALQSVRAAQDGKLLPHSELLSVARCGWLSLVPAAQLTEEMVMRGHAAMGTSLLEAAARTGRIADIPAAIREKAWGASCGHPEITTAMICARNGTLAHACANLADFPDAAAEGLDANKTAGLEEMIGKVALDQMASIGSGKRQDTLMHHAAVHRRFDLLPPAMVKAEAAWMVRNTTLCDTPLHVMLRQMVRRDERSLPSDLVIPAAAWHVENRYGQTPLDIARMIGLNPVVPPPPEPQTRLRHAFTICGKIKGNDYLHSDHELHETFWFGGMTPQSQGRYWETWAASGRAIGTHNMAQILQLSKSQQTEIALAGTNIGHIGLRPVWKQCALERGSTGCPLHHLIRHARKEFSLRAVLHAIDDMQWWTAAAGGTATTLDLAIEHGLADLVPLSVRDKAAWGPFLATLPGTPPEDIARITKISQRLDAALEPSAAPRATPAVAVPAISP